MSKVDTYPTKSSGPPEARQVTGTDITGDKHALDVVIGNPSLDVTGEFTPTGLMVEIKITTLDVGDTESALPATALSGRNSIVVHNTDLVETLYVGPTGVTADNVVGTTSGHEIGPRETFALDIQDDIVLYGIAPTGKTIRVKVTEVA